MVTKGAQCTAGHIVGSRWIAGKVPMTVMMSAPCSWQALPKLESQPFPSLLMPPTCSTHRGGFLLFIPAPTGPWINSLLSGGSSFVVIILVTVTGSRSQALVSPGPRPPVGCSD